MRRLGFVAWMLVGAIWAAGFVAYLAILVWPLAVAATAALCISPRTRSGAMGIVSGVGSIALLGALADRSTNTGCFGSGEPCHNGWHSWPFAVFGIVLIATGVIVFIVQGRRMRRRTKAEHLLESGWWLASDGKWYSAEAAPGSQGWLPPIAAPASRRRGTTAIVVALAAVSVQIIFVVWLVSVSTSRPPHRAAFVPPAPFAMYVVDGVESVSSRPANRCAQTDVADRLGKYCYRVGALLASNSDIVRATPVLDRISGWQVDIEIRPAVLRELNRHVGQDVAIVVDNRVQSVPRVKPGIAEPNMIISGSFTDAEARQLAWSLLKTHE